MIKQLNDLVKAGVCAQGSLGGDDRATRRALLVPGQAQRLVDALSTKSMQALRAIELLVNRRRHTVA